MIQKNIMPLRLIADGNRHPYLAKLNGKWQLASYIAARDSFGSNKEFLMCSYGLINSPEQHTFSNINRNEHHPKM